MTDHNSYAERRRRFRSLHESGCFLLPNPWDAGGAMRLEKLGFQALASSSSACAMALGREDYQITLDESLEHLKMLVAATSLPVNADFESGFADEPEGVAEHVRRAIDTGIAGISIEDRVGETLYEPKRAAERIAAARAAIRGSGADVVLVARTESYFTGSSDPRGIIFRLERYAEAGADCLYAPGATDLGVIADIVKAVAPRPVNVLLFGAAMRVADLARIGVRRVSLGGALAGAAWRGFTQAAELFLTEGRLGE